MTPRLTANFWVRAYLNRLRLANIPAYVLARGDPTAGAVLVKLATLDGQARLYERIFDPMADRRRWVERGAAPEAEIDALIDRDRSRDRDLWVIEVEDRRARHLLDEPGLDE